MLTIEKMGKKVTADAVQKRANYHGRNNGRIEIVDMRSSPWKRTSLQRQPKEKAGVYVMQPEEDLMKRLGEWEVYRFRKFQGWRRIASTINNARRWEKIADCDETMLTSPSCQGIIRCTEQCLTRNLAERVLHSRKEWEALEKVLRKQDKEPMLQGNPLDAPASLLSEEVDVQETLLEILHQDTRIENSKREELLELYYQRIRCQDPTFWGQVPLARPNAKSTGFTISVIGGYHQYYVDVQNATWLMSRDTQYSVLTGAQYLLKDDQGGFKRVFSPWEMYRFRKKSDWQVTYHQGTITFWESRLEKRKEYCECLYCGGEVFCLGDCTLNAKSLLMTDTTDLEWDEGIRQIYWLSHYEKCHQASGLSKKRCNQDKPRGQRTQKQARFTINMLRWETVEVETRMIPSSAIPQELEQYRLQNGKNMKYVIDLRKLEWIRMLAPCDPNEEPGAYVINEDNSGWKKTKFMGTL